MRVARVLVSEQGLWKALVLKLIPHGATFIRLIDDATGIRRLVTINVCH